MSSFRRQVIPRWPFRLASAIVLLLLSACGDKVEVSELTRDGHVMPAVLGRHESASMVARRVLSPGQDANTEDYGRIDESGYHDPRDEPLSTFAADVDRASYSNVRRLIAQGTLPPRDAVRIEELINYFPYAYPAPASDQPIAVSTALAPAPWNAAHRILRVGLRTAPIAAADLPPANLVFLVDVSGSMADENKLPLVQQALALLAEQLRPQDRIAIVVYATQEGLRLPSTPGNDRGAILAAIEDLHAGGSTAGGAGIELAYKVARKHFIRGGNNRVILATDGDFNVGVSSTAELTRIVEERAKDGVFLTVLGVGGGNLKDDRMEQLADRGNGNYAYLDDLMEARKVLVREMGGTLLTVAKDVKIQVEFNPAMVKAYRLIGYENRLLAAKDFEDDGKDAGEVGAGHSVTALYEIVPADAGEDASARRPPPLTYQTERDRSASSTSGELATVAVRFKAPDGDRSRSIRHAIPATNHAEQGDLRFAMAVAGYGLLLRDSPHKGSLTYDRVIALAEGLTGDDPERRGFIDLVRATQRIAR